MAHACLAALILALLAAHIVGSHQLIDTRAKILTLCLLLAIALSWAALRSLSLSSHARARPAADATRLAAQLEERLAAGYADLVQATAGDTRRTGLEWLTDAAVRAVRWRGTSVAFPGLPERG